MSAKEIILYDEPSALAGLSAKLPALFLPEEKTAERFFGFFTTNISNPHTPRAHYRAACRFADWCEGNGVAGLTTPWGTIFVLRPKVMIF